ncbi:MAG: hypothetical protein E7354_00180 [Clostridiales bacterium]|nr:hypothetical protein [Clostridiales bacterium]
MKSKTLNALFTSTNFPDMDTKTILYEYYTYQCKELKENNIKCINLKDFLNTIKDSKEYKLFTDNIDNIQKEFLYTSKTHGYLHNERVALFSYYLALNNNLDTRDIQLSLYAAMYHDIGRIDDSRDIYHGLNSAIKLANLKLDITQEEMNILKTIITCHSLHDEWFDTIAKENQIQDYNRTKTLFNILKDADGLDRARLGCPHIAEDFLRNKVAIQMIPVAYQIINFYNHI